ncbi:hypothetical protein JW721_04305 [Candidatus Micrarchaeota archaeon]|nr:hypothetical protein [Candidatus Micrarchaeota archaeon]
MNRFFLALLILAGCANALWIDAASEYAPYENIEIGVSGAEGTIVFTIYAEGGEEAYSELRAVQGSGRDEWGYYRYSYESFEFSLPSGDYTVRVRDDLEDEEEEFRVTSIGIAAAIGKEGKGLFLYKEDGSAIEGGNIFLHYGKEENETIVETVSGAWGIFNFETENLSAISAEYVGEETSMEIYSYDYPIYEREMYYYEDYAAYAFSDKELYQPGETVHFSSVIFLDNGDSYETIEGEVDVEIRDPDYGVVYSKPVGVVNSRVSLDFVLDEEAALGRYSVSMRKGEDYVGWHSFEVQEYKRPEIKVSLSANKERFVVNETIWVEVDTQYYFGQSASAQADFEIYASPYYWSPYYLDCMCIPYYNKVKVAEGTVYTVNGTGKIEWRGANETGMYEIGVKVADDSEVVSEESLVVAVLEKENLNIIAEDMQANESGLVTILSYDENEEALDTSGSIRIYHEEDYYYYRSRNEWMENATPIFEDEFETQDGQYSFSFTPTETGQYVVYAEAGSAEAFEYFYVSEWSYWSWSYLEVSLDKEEYSAGERMEVTLTSPVAGRLIAISEGGGLGISFFEIEPGVNSLYMEAGETSSINFYAIKGGERYSGYANYLVRGEEWLEVGLGHNEVYGPGDTATIQISAQSGGEASDATASVAIVDQAIIDLSDAQWRDVYSYFYGYPLEDYTILFSWDSNIYPYRSDGLVYAAGGIVEESAQDAPSPTKDEIRVREKFIETALWIPYVFLEGGEAEVVWHIPDTLTTWNITAVASRGTSVGMGTSSAIVTKDVIGRLSPPAALVVGDVAAIPATLFNYGNERVTFKATLETAGGIEVLGSPVRYLSLESGEDVTAYFPLKAIGRGDGELLLWVEGGEGDAVKLPLQIKEMGIEVFEGESGAVDDSGSVDYDSPEGAEVSLSLHSSVLASAFESLDYLVSYPYGCIEQTMSGFLPDVVLIYALDELGLEYAGEENLSALIDDGLGRIYAHQNTDGSWGWFNGQDERISAYVMDGLFIAENAGISVDFEVYESGLKWLRGAQSPYALFVLNRIAGGEASSYPEGVFGELSKCTDGECSGLISSLECFGDYCRLEYDEGYRWYHSDTELTSYALEAFAKNGEMEYARKCVNWLMLEKKGRYWVSTKDTARTVLALTEYAKVSGELRSDYIATVYLDGEKVYEGRMGDEGVGSVEIALIDGSHKLTLERDGFGPLYYTLGIAHYSDEIPEGEIAVSREYERTVSRVGDEIKVKLTVNGSGEYVAIEDPIPLGSEIVREEAGRYWHYYGGYRMEAREDRAVFFLNSLEGGVELEYTLRVTHKGDFTALPTHAYAMYAPEHSGYSDFTHFVFYEKAYVEPHITEYNTTIEVYWEGDGPALLRVSLGGIESEHEVLPGANTIVVEGSGELSYSFESEEEYFEVEGYGRGAQVSEEAANIMPFILAAVVIVAFAYLWKKK